MIIQHNIYANAASRKPLGSPRELEFICRLEARPVVAAASGCHRCFSRNIVDGGGGAGGEREVELSKRENSPQFVLPPLNPPLNPPEI